MAGIIAYIKANWKTNLAALAAFVFSVPQFVTAISQYRAGEHVDWRGALISVVIAAGLAAAKDGDNHSTLAQVQAKQAQVEGDPNAPVLVKAANDQIANK